MNDTVFDIIVVTDPRFQGGTSSAVAAEITAATRAGYRVGLVSYEAANLRQPFPFNPRLRALVDRKDLTLIFPGTPVQCTLAVLHNPFVAGLEPVEPLNITAQKRLVIAHHPPIDGLGCPSYDLETTIRNAQEILGGPADWAPVGPNARDAFLTCPDAPDLLAQDWANVIDFDAWRHVPPPRSSTRITIGRHSRADPRKLPGSRSDFVTIYGDGSKANVDLLGCAPQSLSMLAPIMPNWELRSFGEVPVRDYLDGLDAFVYYHRNDWIEAFGYAIIEAMARGIPCVLPPSFASSFANAAQIAPIDDAFDAALAVAETPNALRDAGYDLIQDHHSFDAVTRRLNDLIGAPSKPMTAAARSPEPDPAVLFVSTNGIGMGHLTRTIAMARRVQAPVKPVLITMSHGAAVADDFGLHVDFIPYHNYLGVDKHVWNAALRDEMKALIDGHGARVVVFDGNSPFQGLLDALDERPHVWSIWSRRGMWRANSNPQFIDRENRFDAVIEPRDLASAFDVGPTAQSTNLTSFVDPVRLLDRHEILPRDVARAQLGLGPNTTTFLIQLGGGNNFDMRLIRDLALRHLGNRPDVEVVILDWKISSTHLPEKLPANTKSISTFPISRYLNAFDATISAVGYNSFHEAIDAGLPAILVPNENPSQDDQLARASFAARHGAALVARRDQPEGLIAALQTILDPKRRLEMVRACNRISSANGAAHAADIIRNFSQCSRGHRKGQIN